MSGNRLRKPKLTRLRDYGKREFDFFELIRLIIRNRKFIIIFVAVVSVAAVIYSLVTPQIWRSTATFYVIGPDPLFLST